MLTGKTVVLGISGSIAAYRISGKCIEETACRCGSDHDRECHTVHHTGDL